MMVYPELTARLNFNKAVCAERKQDYVLPRAFDTIDYTELKTRLNFSTASYSEHKRRVQFTLSE